MANRIIAELTRKSTTKVRVADTDLTVRRITYRDSQAISDIIQDLNNSVREAEQKVRAAQESGDKNALEKAKEMQAKAGEEQLLAIHKILTMLVDEFDGVSIEEMKKVPIATLNEVLEAAVDAATGSGNVGKGSRTGK